MSEPAEVSTTDEPPCPDCGNDPADDSLHRDGCRRIFAIGDPMSYLQFGPPWKPWPGEETR